MKNQLIKFLALSMITVGFMTVTNAQQPQQPQQPKPAQTDVQKMKKTPEQQAEMRANRLKTELNLSDDQVVKMKQVFLKQENDRAAEMECMKTVRANRQAAKDELSKILTPEQLQKFQQPHAGQGNKPQDNQGDNK